MRVADRSTGRNYLKYLNNAKTDYAKTLERIASGNRFEKISEDVSSGARVLQARSEKYKVEKQLSNVKSINEEMDTMETAMTSIEDILLEIHPMVERAKNAATGDSGREALANEIKAMREEIIQFANTQYGNRYVFGGTNASHEAPFSADPDTGKLLYNGIDVDIIKQGEDGTYYYEKEGDFLLDDLGNPVLDAEGNPVLKKHEIPMDGDVFLDIGLGIRVNEGSVNLTTGAEMMPNVDPDTGFKISYSGLDLLGFGTNEEGVTNNIYNLLTEIENNIRNFNELELEKFDNHFVDRCDLFRANLTDMGAKTNFLDTMQSRLENSVDNYKIRINNLMGINDAEEATNQTMNEYVLKAVLQMGSVILPVSLMDFLN